MKEIIEHLFDKERARLKKTKEENRFPDPPVSLHHPSGQRVLRTLAWDLVEKLAQIEQTDVEFLTGTEEAIEARDECLRESLRIVIQLELFAGVSPSALNVAYPNRTIHGPDSVFWYSIYHMGIAMRYLNKEIEFRSHMVEVFYAHLHVWSHFGFGEEAFRSAALEEDA